MKVKSLRGNTAAFSLIELGVLMVLSGLLAVLLLPALAKGNKDSQRIKCLENLKQIGLGLREFSNENAGEFPWQVPTPSGAVLQPIELTSVFVTLSNYVGTPKVFVCPRDQQKVKETVFERFSQRNVSYFIGLDADSSSPQSIVTGDRDITGGSYSNGITSFSTKKPKARWSQDIHKTGGNIGLADGSVQRASNDSFNKHLQSLTNLTARFLIP